MSLSFIHPESPARDFQSIKLASDTYSVNQILAFSKVKLILELASGIAQNSS